VLDILIIGAGMSGLTAGRRLHAAGWGVAVVDKGRVPGGRMATRSFEGGRFDYGAQFFTLRDDALAAMAAEWQAVGLAEPWTQYRFRAPRGMRSIAERLAEDLDVRTGVTVARIAGGGEQWRAWTMAGEELTARTILLTAPVPQSLALLDAGGVVLDEDSRLLLRRAQYRKCLTVLARVDSPVQLGERGFAEPGDGVLSWVADNYVKGVSGEPGALTLHATAEFSERNWETSSAEVLQRMMAAAEPYLQGRGKAFYVHRWRYAEPVETLPHPFHAVGRLVFAGDVFGGPRVGGAVRSGAAAAEYLLRSYPPAASQSSEA
jgi:renalase